MLTLACDQFIVTDSGKENLYVLEGYPWFNESGRSAMIGLPGLTLATRRHDDAKQILKTYSQRMVNGVLPNQLFESDGGPTETRLEYGAADVTLWWAWALYHYTRVARDHDFVREQLPLMLEAAKHYINGTAAGIKIDPNDGLLRCARAQHEFTWMDTAVAGIPITPRSGKAVEMSALWYNFLHTIISLASTVSLQDPYIRDLEQLAGLCKTSMQKFWNPDALCLYDVIERGNSHSQAPDASIRPNQIFAISLPYRAFSSQQEKSILLVIESSLLTPQGLRTLRSERPWISGNLRLRFQPSGSISSRFVISQRHCLARGFLALTATRSSMFSACCPILPVRIGLVLQPLLSHLNEEGFLGSIVEIFDGSRPHLARGCGAHSLAVAETMRWLNWQSRR